MHERCPCDLTRPSLLQAAYVAFACLHGLEAVARPPQHLPDLFVVLNQTVAAGVFGLAYLWTWKRLLQESWAMLGIMSERETDVK